MPNNNNTKIYLIISGAIILLFILIIIIPFAKKSPSLINNQSINSPTPTGVDLNFSGLNDTQISTSEFTGAIEEDLPDNILNFTYQKKELRLQLPIQFSLFIIDFDYGEDKFIVTLSEPKDQARTEFESWKSSTYPALTNDQFNFK